MSIFVSTDACLQKVSPIVKFMRLRVEERKEGSKIGTHKKDYKICIFTGELNFKKMLKIVSQK